eukprot:m.352673 g.352673  ORF g.352673 m.352673 type:complete len:67 (+) comp16582_c0_seq1:31-231(+)
MSVKAIHDKDKLHGERGFTKAQSEGMKVMYWKSNNPGHDNHRQLVTQLETPRKSGIIRERGCVITG